MENIDINKCYYNDKCYNLQLNIFKNDDFINM